jgi:hypothetical protein
MTDRILTGKTTIIYGAGGSIGGAVARTFARHGAHVDVEAILAHLAGMTMLGRAPALQQIADTAAFLASDGAGAITSGTVNATCGLIAG